MEIGRGAEAVITLENGTVKKWRMPKSYRQPELDMRIRQERTLREARITSDARKCGVLTPIISDISPFELKMEHVCGVKLKEVIDPRLSEKVGEMVGRLAQGRNYSWGSHHLEYDSAGRQDLPHRFRPGLLRKLPGGTGCGCACLFSDP